MSNVQCPICLRTDCPLLPGGTGLQTHDCERCGRFVFLDGIARHVLQTAFERNALARSVISHDIRTSMKTGRDFGITESVARQYMQSPKLPDPHEQAKNLVLWIGDNQQTHDTAAMILRPALAAIVGTAISPNEQGLEWLIHQLEPQRLFDVLRTRQMPPQQHAYRLTLGGWTRYSELRRQVAEIRRAFMAMKFGDAVLDRVLATCFKPAVQRAGFELRPLNEGQGAGLIDNQIRAAIRTARFIIADLSHDNNGAYFEAGFAEGLEIPVIYTCERAKFEIHKTHFDTNHMVTIVWDEGRLDDAGSRLTATIRNTFPKDAKFEEPATS